MSGEPFRLATFAKQIEWVKGVDKMSQVFTLIIGKRSGSYAAVPRFRVGADSDIGSKEGGG